LMISLDSSGIASSPMTCMTSFYRRVLCECGQSLDPTSEDSLQPTALKGTMK
jgi:hypothetical protein